MDEQQNPPINVNRWQLLRDVLVFQAKLLVDGLRDLLMSPASLIAVAVGLLTERDRPDRHYRRLIEMGARSERWINLFGQAPETDEPGIDELFRRLDDRIREQHDRGGVTKQARAAVDRALDSLQEQVANAQERRSARSDASDAAPGSPTLPPPPPAGEEPVEPPKS